MKIFLELLLRLLGVYIKERNDSEQRRVNEQAKDDQARIRANPRDLFDDGVLNNSSGNSTKGTDTVPCTDPTRKQE